jgi:hypothetical protein
MVGFMEVAETIYLFKRTLFRLDCWSNLYILRLASQKNGRTDCSPLRHELYGGRHTIYTMAKVNAFKWTDCNVRAQEENRLLFH